METLMIIAFFILVGLIIIETWSYRNYLEAEKRVEQFEKGIQDLGVTLLTSVNGVNQIAVSMGDIDGRVTLLDKEYEAIRFLLSLHAEALQVKQLEKLFAEVDQLRSELQSARGNQ